jgi:hypothetical protein
MVRGEYKKTVVTFMVNYPKFFLLRLVVRVLLLLLLFVRAQCICPRCTSACRLIVLPQCFRRSHFRRQSFSSSVLSERPLAAKGGTAWARIMADNFA